MKNTENNKPLRISFEEPDHQRLVCRLRKLLPAAISASAADRLASGDPSLLTLLDPEARAKVGALVTEGTELALEKVQGPTADFFPIAYLDIARAAANTVGRVVTKNGRDAIGSGFLISPNLFMTNNHVTGSASDAQTQIVQFGYELDADGKPHQPTEFELDPAGFFLTSPDTQLDFSIVKVGPRVSGNKNLDQLGFCALSDAGDKHAERDFVNIIQHPDGRPKQIVIRENRVIGRGAKGVTLHYGTDTLPGSSGSPAFNDDYEVIALHHAGAPLLEKRLENGQPVPQASNEGIRISAIVRSLKSRLDELNLGPRALLSDALRQRKTARPSLVRPGGEARDTSPVGQASQWGPVINKDGSASWTIPLELSIRLPDQLSQRQSFAQAEPTEDGPAEVALPQERNRPPNRDYSSRKGYDPAFLGVKVPLPALSAANRELAAISSKPSRADKSVLDYHHFSLVLNKRRKMAFYTAVNIDGASAVSVGRENIDQEALEASERWYDDPRAEDDQQLDQSIFDSQKPRMFDRGHLVRRLDPVWGDLAQAANDDTFHFANCSLQHKDFNQSRNLWLGLESFILDQAIADQSRVVVFTGPIFDKFDPPYRGLRVPKQFWKVLVRRVSGKLRATGFVVDQGPLLVQIPEAKARFQPEVFQRRIQLIEELAGMNFGNLRKQDTAKPTEAREGLRPLAKLEDALW
jgi:endonuclease G